MASLDELNKITDQLPSQGKRMPVLFTSHGSPMDIPLSRKERPFWASLHQLGLELQQNYAVKAALIISAHWCTRGTFVNSSIEQRQLFDYYGFPEEYYKVYYKARGAPDIASEVNKIIPTIETTEEWGLDHGAWPMLMHLFPKANIPVFQLSIDYYAKPQYHFDLGKQLNALRDKGILIIGSGSLIHNLELAGRKFSLNDRTPYGWEAEYDAWLTKQLNERNLDKLINYETSHKLGKLASPTPDHFVPVLYCLGLMDKADHLVFFFDHSPNVPAFSERSFILW